MICNSSAAECQLGVTPQSQTNIQLSKYCTLKIRRSDTFVSVFLVFDARASHVFSRPSSTDTLGNLHIRCLEDIERTLAFNVIRFALQYIKTGRTRLSGKIRLWGEVLSVDGLQLCHNRITLNDAGDT